MSHYGVFGRLSADSLTLTGTLKRKITEVGSGTYAVAATDDIIICTGTSIVITLPLIATIGNGAQYTIINNNTIYFPTTNRVTINCNASDVFFNAGTSMIISARDSVTLTGYVIAASADKWELL